MDSNFLYLHKLGQQYEKEDHFPLVDPNFYLTPDGSRWLIQVNENPLLFKFSDHGLLLLGKTNKA